MKKFFKFLIIWWIVCGSLIFLMWRHRINKMDDEMIDVIKSIKTSEIIKNKYGNIKSAKWIKKVDLKYKNITCATFLIKTEKSKEKICVMAHKGISNKNYRLDGIVIDNKLYEFFESFNVDDYKEYIDNYTGEKYTIKYEDYVDIFEELKKLLNIDSSNIKIDFKYDKDSLSYYVKLEQYHYDKKTREDNLVKVYNVIVNKEGVIEAIWYE